MLNNLKAELVRKELNPEKAIMETLGCTPKTASSKLSGKSNFTVPEALKIMHDYFPYDNFEFEFLFADATAVRKEDVNNFSAQNQENV